MIRPTKAARKRTYVQAHHGSGRRARRPDASSGAPAAAAPTRVPACCAGAGDRVRPVVWRRAVLCTPCCLVWSTELIGCARYSMLLHVPARGKGRRSTDHDQSINGRCHLALRRCRCMTASWPCVHGFNRERPCRGAPPHRSSVRPNAAAGRQVIQGQRQSDTDAPE